MCGIAGLLHFDGATPDRDRLVAMVAAMRHRGPDSDGFFHDGPVALGFRRLAILDLTDAGNQPMVSADGQAVAVFNGEVYNWRELRADLARPWPAPGPGGACYPGGYPFRTQTDTEVVLAAFQRWGTDCFSRLNGMWGLAIWDVRNRRLTCARDRFGIKPFYYRRVGGRFAFASSARVLGLLDGGGLSPSPAAVASYLRDGTVHFAAATFFEEVEQLDPATVLTISADGTISRSTYWSIEPREQERTDAEAVEEFRALLFDSVRRHLCADVPVGTCLSGGLDSSSIVCVAADVGDGGDAGRHAFSACFDDPSLDERRWIRAVVEHTGVSWHPVFPTADGLWDDLDDLVVSQEEPTGGSSLYAQWCVMRAARQAGVTVMLDGQGADELLAGYQRYFWAHLAGLVRSGRIRQAWLAARGPWGTASRPRRADLRGVAAFVAPSRSAAAVHRWRNDRRSARWLGEELRGLRMESGPAAPAAVASLLTRTQVVDLRAASLPALLRYEDRSSMAHSVEARVPFLDHRLVECVLSMPDRFRIRDGSTKWVLRASMTGVLPEMVRTRREKLGFATPEVRWMRHLAPRIFADLASGALAHRGWVRTKALQPWFSAADRWTEVDAARAWRLLNAERWLRSLSDSARS